MNNKFVWAVIVVLVVIGFYLYSKPVAPVVLEENTTEETATTTDISDVAPVSAATTSATE